MAKVTWTERALADLDGIAAYIALDKPEAVGALVKLITIRVASLADHPKLGPRIPELLPASRFRQLVEPPCRIFYRYDLKTRTIRILGVMRGERLFKLRLLLARDKES